MGASTCLLLGQRDGGQGSQERSQVTGIPNPRAETRISRHLLQTVPDGCGEDFRAQATAKEWLDLSPPSRDGVFFPGVPTYLARIMYRLRVDCWRIMSVPKPFVCRGAISFHHVLFNCREFSAHFAPVTSSLTSLGLQLASEAWRSGTSGAGACSMPQPNSSTCKCAGRPRTSLAPPVPGLTPWDGGSPPSTQCSIILCF